MTETPAPSEQNHDQTLSNILRINYISVLGKDDIGWPELAATASLLALLSVFCAPFLNLQEEAANVGFQTSFILLLSIVFSLIGTAAKAIFRLEVLKPRRIFLLFAGHYSATLIIVITAVFIWGDAYPFYNDIDYLSLVYPAVATLLFIVLSIAEYVSATAKTVANPETSRLTVSPGTVAAIGFFFVLVNYFNYKIFRDLILVSSPDNALFRIVNSAANSFLGN